MGASGRVGVLTEPVGAAAHVDATMDGMGRRKTRRRASQREASASHPPSLGAHWRADGAPKTAYRSEAEALAMAEERRRETGAVLSVYRCDHCSAWHLGNSGGRHER